MAVLRGGCGGRLGVVHLRNNVLIGSEKLIKHPKHPKTFKKYEAKKKKLLNHTEIYFLSTFCIFYNSVHNYLNIIPFC